VTQTRRGYLRAFVRLLGRIGPCLKYPAEVPLWMGLILSHEIEAYPPIADQIAADLSEWDNRSVADELDVLRTYADLSDFQASLEPQPSQDGKIWSWVDAPNGNVRFGVVGGRLEIHLGKVLQQSDHAALTRAVSCALQCLGDPGTMPADNL